jgi:hypothetical protein
MGIAGLVIRDVFSLAMSVMLLSEGRSTHAKCAFARVPSGRLRAAQHGMPVRIRKSVEVYRPGERLPANDRWMETIARIMDGVIPIGPWKIGLDPLLGLVPGIGDVIAALISMLIVARAVQAGIPRIAVARMVANIAVDTLIGAIPVFGDLFDFGFKSNMKNLRIYEDALYSPRQATARHWAFFLALFLGIGAVSAAMIYGLAALLRAFRP